MIVVDDRILFAVIAGDAPTAVAESARDGVATTFSWYYRLSRAIASDRLAGTLTRAFDSLPEERKALVRAELADLTDIQIAAAKVLVPVMSAVASVATVNLLTADAIATGLLFDAPILVSTQSDVLDAAARVAGVPVRQVMV